MLETVLYSPRLFIVGGEHIAMVMVVVGHICTQISWSYATLSTSYRLKLIHCLRLFVFMATCNLVGKILLTSIISMSNYSLIIMYSM